jgi:hypothetical protein
LIIMAAMVAPQALEDSVDLVAVAVAAQLLV